MCRSGFLAGDQVDDPAGDADGVVGEARVVAAEQCDVDGGLDAVPPGGQQQLAEQLLVQLVHQVVLVLELGGGLDVPLGDDRAGLGHQALDRKSTRLNSSHANISYAVFCLKKKK